MDQVKGKVLSTKQLIETYSPMFTEKNIPVAIAKGMPFVAIGRKRYFIEESIDNWLHQQELSNNAYPNQFYLLGKKDDR